ncbi:trans-aconitate 2-methyltransferase [Nocardioides sp.]|uniref:class I SAM-dependent methyltransferase n=1 Tax=Nocardioides sp. TaxID=35761 RepID=UPI0035AF500F
MADDRSLAMTFDSAAELYQQARPDYPEQLFDDLVEMAGLTPRDRLIEIGCATGKATLPLARRGFAIQCVEPGPALVEVARHNLAGLPVEVQHGRFEDVVPADHEPYDLVLAATAWHWVDPVVRYRRAWELLRPRGHLAFWSARHVFPDGGDPIFAELQEVYDEIGEGLPDGAAECRPGELPDQRAEIEASGFFDDVQVRHLDWEVTYDAEGYLALLDTFSGHIAMQPWQRDRLYAEVRRRLAERPDGLLHRGWGAVLHVARRREQSRLRDATGTALHRPRPG